MEHKWNKATSESARIHSSFIQQISQSHSLGQDSDSPFFLVQSDFSKVLICGVFLVFNLKLDYFITRFIISCTFLLLFEVIL